MDPIYGLKRADSDLEAIDDYDVYHSLGAALLAFASTIYRDDEDLGSGCFTEDWEHDEQIIVVHVFDRARRS
jgi:hypothetical protein